MSLDSYLTKQIAQMHGVTPEEATTENIRKWRKERYEQPDFRFDTGDSPLRNLSTRERQDMCNNAYEFLSTFRRPRPAMDHEDWFERLFQYTDQEIDAMNLATDEFWSLFRRGKYV